MYFSYIMFSFNTSKVSQSHWQCESWCLPAFKFFKVSGCLKITYNFLFTVVVIFHLFYGLILTITITKARLRQQFLNERGPCISLSFWSMLVSLFFLLKKLLINASDAFAPLCIFQWCHTWIKFKNVTLNHPQLNLI